MNKTQKAELACSCLKGIAHPTRILILTILRNGEKTVGQIEAGLSGVKQSNLSQHLIQMKNCGILQNRKDGNQVLYFAANERIYEIIDLMQSIFCRKQ